jgi:hypothetical protein
LQLGEQVAVPGWHRHPLSSAPPPVGRCPPGLGSKQQRWDGHQTWPCTPPPPIQCHRHVSPEADEAGVRAEWGTALVTAMGTAVHRPISLETLFSGVLARGHRHPLSSASVTCSVPQ